MCFVCLVSTGKEEINRKRGKGKEVESIHNKMHTCLHMSICTMNYRK